MTPYDDLAHVVAAAVLRWPAEARHELADWLASSDDRSIAALAIAARTFRPVGPPLRPIPRYFA